MRMRGCWASRDTFVQLFSSLGFAAVVGSLCLEGRCAWGGYVKLICVLVVILLTNVWWINTPQNNTQLAVYFIACCQFISLRNLSCVIFRRPLNWHVWIQEGSLCSEQSVRCLVLLKFRKAFVLLYILSKPRFVLCAPNFAANGLLVRVLMQEMILTAKEEVAVW